MALEVGDRVFDGAVFADNLLMTTTEDLTIPVDYDDGGGGSVGDPPAGTVFTKQSDIDDLLTVNSWTAFKHFQAVVEALPKLIDHALVINIAAGVQRPRVGETNRDAWSLIGLSVTASGSITINGAAPSTWDVEVAAQTITGVQTGSNDPWLDFAGTPFAAQDLRGLHAVLSTGQVVEIWDHTDSRLSVVSEISPTPTLSVDTATVARPSTIIRNSNDDVNAEVAGSAFASYVGYFGLAGFDPVSLITISNLKFEAFGNVIAAAANGESGNVFRTIVSFSQCLVDHEEENTLFGKTTLRGWQTSTGQMQVWNCCYRGVTGDFQPIFAATGFTSCKNNSFYNASFPVMVSGDRFGVPKPLLYTSGCVYHSNDSGNSNNGSIHCVHGNLVIDYFGNGKKNTIRGNSAVGLQMSIGSTLQGTFSQGMEFEGIGGPCVRINSGVLIDFGTSTVGLKDAGNNLDVGIEFTGLGAMVSLPAANDVTGTNGDVRMADGGILTYTEIETDGPMTDGANVVSKDP